MLLVLMLVHLVPNIKAFIMGTIRRLKNKRKVFVVDDNSMCREAMSNDLKQIDNIEVSTFSSAELCLKSMNENPELIILDFYLDGENPENINGHFALERFRNTEQCPKILFVSSAINEELLLEYSNHRDVDFMLKSIYGSKSLIRKVEEKLSEVKSHQI